MKQLNVLCSLLTGALIFFEGVLLLPHSVVAQDILMNPQNQKYVFTAGTNWTQGFLYNPAYLGLYNRGGVLDGYYFYPSKGMLNFPNASFHDIGIFGEDGKFGLGYRNAATSQEILNQYSVGLGLGNEGIAAGISLSLINITGLGTRGFPSVGLIIRPDRYISLGAAYHNFSKFAFGSHMVEKNLNVGIGIRPFGTDFFTLNADLMTPIHNDGYKIGASVELLPGLQFYGIYDRSGYTAQPPVIPAVVGPSGGYSYPFMWGNSFSVGLSFNFGSHIHIEGASSYKSGGYAATFGRVTLTSEELPTILLSKRVAEVSIGGSIPEGSKKTLFFMKPRRVLLDYVKEIKKCGDDPSIVAVILKISRFSTSESFFALSSETQELSDAVEYVRSKGKKVYAYLTDDSGVNEIYLASAADKIYMAPVAFISGYGVNMDLIRLKGLFDKLHISWNAQTAGKYKSTFHTIYTDSATSEQAKLIQGLVDDIYSQMVKQIAVNRHLSFDDSAFSVISGIVSSSQAVRLHILDKVAYYDEFKEEVNRAVFGKSGKIAPVDPATIRRYETSWGTKPEIAVIGVYGDIVTGKSSPPSPIPIIGGGRTSGSETVVEEIKAAAADNNVKAIVLRVNSGGGSALASDEICNAIENANQRKPVIASFGNVAASGGYYVAVGARRIFAEPATVTGSIGVMIAFPVFTDFIQRDLGSNIENYKAGQSQQILSPFHRWNTSDLKAIDEFLGETYNNFKAKVADGRKMALDSVEELAQGKVYTGEQAKPLNLIDEYGGLDKAIQYAADIAGVPNDYRIKMFTVPGMSIGNIFNFDESILEFMGHWDEPLEW
jgi:protease-4